MSSQRCVELTVSDDIAEIQIDNPPLNLLTVGIVGELTAAVGAVADRDDVRAVLLTAAGERAFCAGSDMKEFAAVRPIALREKLFPEHQLLRQLAGLPMPTIAVMEGAALGGGLELAVCCDLRVASVGCILGFPEVGIGGLASVGTQRLPRIIGVGRAKELILLGRTVTAEEALSVGLVTVVTERGQARNRALDLARSLAGKGPVAVRLAKHLIDVSLDLPIDSGLALALDAAGRLFDTDDLAEGARAFFEHREPKFSGR